MTQNVVTHPLNPRTVRLADAFFDLEDDMNVAFRQSRLATIALEQILGEVQALHKTAEQRGDSCTEYHLRQIKRGLSAAFDAVTEVDAAASRLEHRYYLAESA